MKNFSKRIFFKFKLFSVFFFLLNLCTTSTVFAESNKITTQDGLISTLKTLCNSFGAFSVFIAVIFIGIKLVLNANKTEEREKLMSAFSKVIIGAIILASASAITSVLLNMQKEITVTKDPAISEVEYLKADEKAKELEDEDDTFFMRAIVAPINAVTKLIYGGDDSEGILNKVLGFKSLDQLIYADNTDISPFDETEWSNLIALYIRLTTVCIPLLFIMVAKTGFSFIINASSPNKIQEAKEDLSRWFFSIFIIAIGPFLIRFIFLLCGSLTNILSTTMKSGNFEDKLNLSKDFINGIHTGSIFTTAIVKFMFAALNFKINLVFIVRKIILSVMVVFTPLAATFWGINKKVNAFQVWMGEIITNASITFFYALTFTIMNVTVGKSTLGNWIYVILWLMMCMKLADMLRNTLQGFITKLSGINELNEARRGGVAVGSMIGGAMGAFSASGLGNIGKGKGKFSMPKFGGSGAVKNGSDGLASSIGSSVGSVGRNAMNSIEKNPISSPNLQYDENKGISLNKNAQSNVDKLKNDASSVLDKSSGMPNLTNPNSIENSPNELEQMEQFYGAYNDSSVDNEDLSQFDSNYPTDSGMDYYSSGIPGEVGNSAIDNDSSVPTDFSGEKMDSEATSNPIPSPKSNYSSRIFENYNNAFGDKKGKNSTILRKTGSALKTAGTVTGKVLNKTANIGAPILANMVTGGDMELKRVHQAISNGIPQMVSGGIGAVQGTSNAIGNLGNSIKMGHAVYTTAKEVAKEEGISKNEALGKIMGTKTEEGVRGGLSAYMNSAKIITAAASKDNQEKVTKIIARTPSYTGIESFNGWKEEWGTEKNSELNRRDN